jgi:phosphatidylglycerophosphatase A
MRKFILFFATGGGAGYLPKAPGTFGSIVGLGLVWCLKDLSLIPACVTLAALLFLSVWSAGLAEGLLGVHDPQVVVIDEVIGIWVALFLLPWSWQTALIGFVLFRAFDIWKPFPVCWFQDRLPGGWGIVMDDVMAGVYANIILRVILGFL